MLKQRLRKCARCGLQSANPRCFPSNVKPHLQRLWVASLGLDPDATSRELETIRDRLTRKEDIRWCHAHFDEDTGYPLKVHTVDDEASVMVREKRRRVDDSARVAVVMREKNEGEGRAFEGTENGRTDDDGWQMGFEDDGQFGTTDPLGGESPIRPHLLQSPIRPHPPLSLSQLALDSSLSVGDRAVDPAIPRFDSIGSTMPTIERTDSSFRLSQLSQSSETEEEEEEDDETLHSSYFLTAVPKIESLFRRCQECGEAIDQTSVEKKQVASALSVTYQCMGCKEFFRWDSQPKKGKGKSQVFELNQSLPVAAFVTGTPIPRFIEMCDLLSVGIPRERSMRDSIRHYACPAIDRVYDEWEQEARTLSKDTAPEEGIIVALDGQFDSPGYCASACKVAAFDASLKLIIGAVSLSLTDPGIEGKSCRMETFGAEKVLELLVDDGFNVRTRVTDSNASVDKRIRDNPKLAHIEAMRDFWHVQKPLKKEWAKCMKLASCPTLSVWYKSFINHLYFVNKRYPKREDRPLALEYVRSFVYHFSGKHKWRKGEHEDFKLISKCLHCGSRAKRGKKGKKGEKAKEQKELVEVDSEEYRLVYEMLFTKSFEKAFLACSPEVGTSMCECFHSMSLMYSPKRFYAAPIYFNKKMKLSVLHSNSLVYSELAGERVEMGDCLLPRKGRIAISVKRKMSKGKHPWRREIIEECWKVREDYEDKRYFKRIGAPEDDLFDILMIEYEKIVRGEEIDADEGDSDYSVEI